MKATIQAKFTSTHMHNFFVVKTRPKEKQTRLKLNQQLVSNHQQWFPRSKTIESNGAPEKQKATFVGQSLHWCLDFLDLCLKVFSAGLLPNCKVVQRERSRICPNFCEVRIKWQSHIMGCPQQPHNSQQS